MLTGRIFVAGNLFYAMQLKEKERFLLLI